MPDRGFDWIVTSAMVIRVAMKCRLGLVVLSQDLKAMSLTQPGPQPTPLNPLPSPIQPLSPLTSWPIQLSNPEVGFAWYLSPATLVTQAATAHASSHVSTVLSDWVDLILERHHEEISRCKGLLGIHDWRRFRTYDSEARCLWMERIRRRPKGYLRKGIIIVADTPLIKMAVAGANMIVSLATGGDSRFELATNASQVLRECNVRPPRP